MGKNSRRRNPPRKASIPTVNTNSSNNKHRKKSRGKAILADNVQEQKNETLAIAWTNDKDANDAPTAEHSASATEESIEEDEEVAIDSKYQPKHPPKVVTFEMLKDYMHKPEYLDRNLLLEIIELGKQAFEILLRDGKAVSMEEFRKINKISQSAQEVYSTGDTRIKSPRIPREDNEMNENYSKVCIYVIIFIDEHGKIYVIKAGMNGDGKREGDYDLKSGRFRYVEIVSFHAASDKAEAELVQVYKKFLQRMVEREDCPSDFFVCFIHITRDEYNGASPSGDMVILRRVLRLHLLHFSSLYLHKMKYRICYLLSCLQHCFFSTVQHWCGI
ncbi:predicted protein [Chaetoceros tenuissimus]|uniref:Uncharacterized protein n=1 Tax=Chaetoceros tenuissimus TaxID=426638 RepID=A0AAD3H844_9STRA|nr:predicted protein [Chaetoceros tenuissimus]